MSEQVLCVCGHPVSEHGPQADWCVGGGDTCDCELFQPCLPWPDSEGWWHIQHTKYAWDMLEIGYFHNERLFLVCRSTYFNREQFEQVFAGPARFIKLIEESPFKTK